MINSRKKHFVLHAYRTSFRQTNPKSKWIGYKGGFGFQIETKRSFFGLGFLELDFWRKTEEQFDEKDIAELYCEKCDDWRECTSLDDVDFFCAVCASKVQ